MPRATPHVLSARVTRDQLVALRRAAAARNSTPSSLVRCALWALTRSANNSILAAEAELLLGKVGAALGLPADASQEDIVAAIGALLDAVGGPIDALDTADAASEAPGAPPAKPLSARAKEECKRLGISEAEFRTRVASAATRAGRSEAWTVPASDPKRLEREREGARRLGISIDEFRARKRAAARRG